MKRNKSWDIHYETLLSFVKEHSRLPKSSENIQLYNWYYRNKQKYLMDELDSECSEKMRHLLTFDTAKSFTGMVYGNGFHRGMFEKNLAFYQKFVEENGRQPVRNDVFDGINLGDWKVKIKRRAEAGELPDDAVIALQNAGIMDNDALEERWKISFDAYSKYISMFNKKPQPQKMFYGVNIGSWYQSQLSMYKRGILDEKHLKLLQNTDLGFPIVTKSEFSHDDFDANLALYREFKAEYQREPLKEELFQKVCLGLWCTYIRNLYNADRLSAEQVMQLDDAQMPLSHTHTKWNNVLQMYAEFKAEYGREPKKLEKYKGFNLGAWCFTVRMKYKNNGVYKDRNERLTDYEIASLTKLGFRFYDTKETANSQDMIDGYREFKSFHPGIEPRDSDLHGKHSLGVWLTAVQKDYREGLLDEEIERQLLDAGYVFPFKKLTWNEICDMYGKFKEEFKREPLLQQTFHGVRIGKWCKAQREDTELSKEQIEKLTGYGFPFSYEKVHELSEMTEEQLNKGIVSYLLYKSQNQFEPDYNEIFNGFPLGEWCTQMRKLYASGTIPTGRNRNPLLYDSNLIQKLNVAGFEFDNEAVKESQWKKNLELYKQYRRERSVDPTPKTQYQGVNLGTWVVFNRSQYKNGDLSEVRYELLKKAGFNFDPLKERWVRMLNTYKQFKEEYGVEPTAEELYYNYDEEYKKLGKWYTKTMERYKLERFPKEYMEDLRNVGFGMAPVKEK